MSGCLFHCHFCRYGFHLVETVCVELQDNLINDLGGDTGNKSIETMTNMVKNQVLAVQEKSLKG